MPKPRLTDSFPLRPNKMAEACRKLASDLRTEHAKGMDAIQATGSSGGRASRMSRLEAAANMDLQADRWEHEMRTGEKNYLDRMRVDPNMAGRFRSP